jgi:DNA-directed RNA polymerase subunit beta
MDDDIADEIEIPGRKSVKKVKSKDKKPTQRDFLEELDDEEIE